MRQNHVRVLVMTAVCVLTSTVASAFPRETAPPPRVHAAPTIFDYTAHMDVNQIDMVVTNHGSIAYDVLTGNAGFIYPKSSTKTAVFAAGPWIGAKVGGEVRIAVAEYSQEYTSGPMAGGTFQPDNNPLFKSYKIIRGNTTSEDYLNWPVDQGAPVDSTGAPALLGDAMIWSVYNDADPALHTNNGGQTNPLGIEVQQTTFAFNRAGPLGNVIFVRYKLINKGLNFLEDMFVSAWSDPDLGGPTDDLVGCDVPRSMGYVYNATNVDAQYGAQPPAVGFDFFRGPIVPSGTPGVNDTLGMTSFNKYINGTDPRSYLETYNYMLGHNPDGSDVIDPTTGLPTKFQVPGDPVTGTGWLDSSPGDRRMNLSTGPFRMEPGDIQEITMAIIVGQGTDRLSSISDLRNKDDVAQVVFDLNFNLSPPPPTPEVTLDLEPNVVNLKNNAPWVIAYLEPTGFDALDINLSSLRLAGSVQAAPKFATLADHNLNGVPDLMVRFSRPALVPLLALGMNSLEVTGSLVTGETFACTDQLRVIDPGGGNEAASVVPNPFNPSGMLSFRTVNPGRVRVTMFDLQGRLVRTLMETRHLPAGEHEVRIDGAGERGGVLPSGVYFYRVDSPDGTITGRFAILK